jgi:hypothetical protein
VPNSELIRSRPASVRAKLGREHENGLSGGMLMKNARNAIATIGLLNTQLRLAIPELTNLHARLGRSWALRQGIERCAGRELWQDRVRQAQL